LTQNLAQRFNTRYPETFKIPEPLIASEGCRIMDLHDPRKKMSKSTNSPMGLIRLLDPPEVIRAKIASATTDSEHNIRSAPDKPGISNLLTIHSIVSGMSHEQSEATFSGKSYAEFKAALADTLVEYLQPFRDRYELLLQERGYVERTLLEGSYRAQATAIRTLARVYERVGFLESPGV
jgi:tryptophanyl-tRNA synthetase